MEQRQLFLPPDTTGISEPDILTMIVTGLDELLGIEIGLQKKRRAAVAGIFRCGGLFLAGKLPVHVILPRARRSSEQLLLLPLLVLLLSLLSLLTIPLCQRFQTDHSY